MPSQVIPLSSKELRVYLQTLVYDGMLPKILNISSQLLARAIIQWVY